MWTPPPRHTAAPALPARPTTGPRGRAGSGPGRRAGGRRARRRESHAASSGRPRSGHPAPQPPSGQPRAPPPARRRENGTSSPRPSPAPGAVDGSVRTSACGTVGFRPTTRATPGRPAGRAIEGPEARGGLTMDFSGWCGVRRRGRRGWWAGRFSRRCDTSSCCGGQYAATPAALEQDGHAGAGLYGAGEADGLPANDGGSPARGNAVVVARGRGFGLSGAD